MKCNFSIFVIVLLSAGLLCCKQKKAVPAKDANRIDVLAKLKADALKFQDDKRPIATHLAYWSGLLKQQPYYQDSVMQSMLHYYIAGVYFRMDEQDSLEHHMQQAWSLMENQQGFESEKILLFSGLGNVAMVRHLIQQQNYYYQRAARLLIAVNGGTLKPRQQVQILFAAAQSAQKLRQYDTAVEMNRRALKILPGLPDDYSAWFRAYSQMASYFYQSDGNSDSLYHYIQKMEQVYHLAPDHNKARFLYDRKASYFEHKDMMDSALLYSQYRRNIDLKDAKTNGDLSKGRLSGNLFNSYADLSAIHLKARNLDSAAYYLKLCEKLISRFPDGLDENNLILYSQNKAGYLLATNNLKAASGLQQKLVRQYRELYENENARALAEMSALYQLQSKDQSISRLNFKVGETNTSLQRNRFYLIITGLTALLGITFFILLYFIQRQRKLKAENEKAMLNQRLLRTQMEPHFIFNTLAALQSLIRFDEKSKALKYLSQFSKLLRSSLELSRDEMAPLEEEISTLENYLSLQQMRFDYAFTYCITLAEDLDASALYVPPMLIQPFVENAIIHGVSSRKQGGEITVRFSLQGKMLEVQVTDNGAGLSVNPEEGNSPHHSLSTQISRERLTLLSRDKNMNGGIDISHTAQGTAVLIRIPVF